MKRTAVAMLAVWIGVVQLWGLADDNRPYDRAQRALKQKDYGSAITICLDLLESAPGDYDVNFLLVQAYSRSGERDKALARLEKMSSLFPRNGDVILFTARILAWKGRSAEALEKYKEVLGFDPANEEALVGTADIAARRKDFPAARAILQRVLQRNPRNADAYYHLGLVDQWQGDRGRAREEFEKAVALDPANDDYKIFLTSATPRLQRRLELRYGHEVEGWSDGRADFQDDQVVLLFGLPQDAGVMILKYNQTHRFGETDRQFEAEAYPRLWTKTYARLDLTYSPEAVYYPRLSALVEIYQGLFSAAEVSLGVWHMSFADRPVTLVLGSLGYYLGNYYPYVRLNYGSENGNSTFSWALNLRRYFSTDNFISVGYGHGTRLLEDLTVQDLLATPGNITLAGVTWYIFGNIRLEFQFSRTSDQNLTRNTFEFTTGYRWR
jgi:YaiO family outer membrane protein